MIVRTVPTVEGVLMATPAIREFRLRHPDERVVVETALRELLWGNEDVEDVGCFMEPEPLERVVRLDMVEVWRSEHLVDLFAKGLLGDARLSDRRIEMRPDRKQEEEAARIRSGMGDRVAVVALPTDSFAGAVAGFEDLLREAGYDVMPAAGRPLGGWGVLKAVVDLADVFVGVDGCPEPSVASATETPMVVAHSWRDPRFSRPFRRGVPFEAVTPGSKCDAASFCMEANVRGEFCHVYRVECSNEDRMACERAVTAKRLMRAVGRVVP